MLALREARIGVLAATIAAMGSAFAEVGAVVLVGGNLDGDTQTLASAVLVRVSAGEYGRADRVRGDPPRADPDPRRRADRRPAARAPRACWAGRRERRRSVLRARGLAVARAGVEVVRDVDLDVGAGEIVVVIGPNGAGKSTLLAALAGLLPAGRGSVERTGRVAAALQAPALANRSARANVEAALGWWGVARGERRERALAALGDDRRARPGRPPGDDPLRRRGAARAPRARARPAGRRAAPRRAVRRARRARARRAALRRRLGPARRPARDARRRPRPRRGVGAGRPRRRHARRPRGRRRRARRGLRGPPTPEVAPFVGFAGRLEEPGALRLAATAGRRPRRGRPAAAPASRGSCPSRTACASSSSSTTAGSSRCAPAPGPAPGDEVGVRLLGGVSFAR